MATDEEKLDALRKAAARQLLDILTAAHDSGAAPHANPLVAQYVAVVEAVDIAKEQLNAPAQRKPAASFDAASYDPVKGV